MSLLGDGAYINTGLMVLHRKRTRADRAVTSVNSAQLRTCSALPVSVGLQGCRQSEFVRVGGRSDG
ncbi:hypothetical protein [Streptomyces sp. 184]|uniref:hypothetical protein n=1 Tax=Streptomyces sp. 184 TaxID=1827526 RepID=UPI00389286B2